jgi:hypothetical protein
MPSFESKIETFFKKRHEIFRKPLEKIINLMLNKCRYINGESLERHNWGETPLKLNFIPTNINSPSFEADLIKALGLNENEQSIIELLWGDIQLGKRVQACIIMWISVHILKRPVLYIFRNLSIDQKQLQDDIVGTENYNFNIQFIKNLFDNFNSELQEFFEEKNVEYWKDYKLPELKDINSNDIINKLSNKEAINSNDIFCCLMNHAQLEKINKKFNEYIFYNNELVNMSVLVDESDLMSPTASNDKSSDNDKKDSTICEILLAKIYKKVKYALHITGTAHSLLYNITTRLSDNADIQLKISKVHKMKRSDDYFGLFSNSIHFNTEEERHDEELTAEEKIDKQKKCLLFKKPVISSWWDSRKYDIVEDYTINIKKIIEKILKRKQVKYNSLLISEEKIRTNQFSLVNKILKDFPDLFIVIYHGNCLRLYLSKDYEKEIKCWSQWDAKKSSTSQRLWQDGGIYGSSIDTEKSEKLPNNYCYFNINTKILNIKFIYKLLRILFEKSEIQVKNKTAITITGKYGERGYSFTSDDYDKYSFHLTDQYFVSHASFNCTDISQRLRLQGKYNDIELKNGAMKLALWTTPILQDIIQNFYVKFIKEIEKFIMGCETWEDIKDLLESIIDNGEFKFGKYMTYIDVSKKRKNLQPQKHFDRKNNGYKLILTENMNDTEIADWCKEANLPHYLCVNEIKEIQKDKFIEKYGIYKIKQEFRKLDNFTFEEINKIIDDVSEVCKIKLGHISLKWLDTRLTQYTELGYYPESVRGSLTKILKTDLDTGDNMNRFGELSDKDIQNRKGQDGIRRVQICYDENNELYICVLLISKDKILPKQTNNYIKNTPYFVNGDVVKYSVLKEEYRENHNDGYINEDGDNFIEDGGLPRKYYWKTPDGWLYLFDKDKPEIISLNIIGPSKNPLIMPSITSTIPSINNDVLLFTNACFKKTDKPNLRFGLKEIYTFFETWCKLNSKITYSKTQKKFKEELEKLNYREEKSKGVDINHNPGKRGYNIMVLL